MVKDNDTLMGPPPVQLPLLGEGGDNVKPALGKDKEKGTRQSFSCAECRRLKLKCSRVWPCTSCEKRGCAQICPNGEMRTGKGKRLILADTEELHRRIAALEVALAASHAKTSSTPHPLLNSPYLFSPRDPPARPYPTAKPGTVLQPMREESDEEIVDGAFGTLTIGTEGEARFVGSFAGSEYLREEGADASPESTGMAVGSEIRADLVTPPATAGLGALPGPQSSPYRESEAEVAAMLASSPLGAADVERLREELPDWETEGRILVESYWENVNWMYQIIPRPMFDSDHLMSAYDTESTPNAHKLACVFFIMAIGVMFDLHRQPYDPRGERLFALGRACLAAVGLEHASPATVQALHLSGTYMMNDKHGNGAEIFWPVLGTTIKVAQSLGLHRDGSNFGLSQYEIEERRQVWWEVVTYDRLQAMCFGRPCGSSNRASDTKFPVADEKLIGDKDGYHRSKYTLMKMMEKVIDVQTQTTPVAYTTVQALDQEFMQYKKQLPEALLPSFAIQDLPLDRMFHPHLVIHRLGIRLLFAQTRLLLNRPSFARALKDHPSDPSRAKFGTSFVALYESAQEIVQLVKQLVIYHPSLIARWWFFWFHAFSSAVCLSAIAIRAPASAFAAPAFHGMSIVCDISAAARPGCRAKKGLPILVRLRKRAQESLMAVSKDHRRDASQQVAELSSTPPDEDDLSHLGGQAKLRRVGGSASPTQRKGSLSTVSPRSEGTPSPRTTGSNATLAEPQHYDPVIGRMLEQPTYEGVGSGGGVVRAPTTMPSQAPVTSSSGTGVSPSLAQILASSGPMEPSLGGGVGATGGTNWFPTPPSFEWPTTGLHLSADLDSWNMDGMMSRPQGSGQGGMGPNRNGFGGGTMDGLGVMEWLDMGIGMDADMGVALGMPDGGFSGAQGGDIVGFDFEAFVAGMGEGRGEVISTD